MASRRQGTRDSGNGDSAGPDAAPDLEPVLGVAGESELPVSEILNRIYRGPRQQSLTDEDGGVEDEIEIYGDSPADERLQAPITEPAPIAGEPVARPRPAMLMVLLIMAAVVIVAIAARLIWG